MVYMNLLRRSSARFCQQQQQALLSAPSVTTAPIVSASASIRNFASVATINTRATTAPIHRESPFEQELNYNYNNIVKRSKHSSTQIKRLFKQNPARRRIAKKQQQQNDADGNGNGEEQRERDIFLTIPESTIQPVHSDPKILTNGWNAPVGGSGDHPFQVVRTKNKPNNAVGFLPVYSEYRKDGARVTTRIRRVSGDRGLFLNELRAALQIPIPKNPREDTIRIRTGGTIEIKGNRVLEVKTWLAGLGF